MTSTECRALKTKDGLNTEIPSLLRLKREGGPQVPLAICSRLISQANALCDGKLSKEQVVLFSEMVMENFGMYNLAVLAKAIRDGLSSGKIYGTLTYPQIAEWIQSEVENLENYAHDQHSRTKL